MGASQSLVAIVPEPLKLEEVEVSTNPAAIAAADMLPQAFRHLSQFPVLAKMKLARGAPIKWHPNDRITHFLKESAVPSTLIADFLCVRDRLVFLQTHKVRLPPKRLKPLLFNGPSRELTFLYCGTSTAMPSSNPAASGAGTVDKQEAQAAYLSQCLSLEVRYRGSFLYRAVPLRLVASSLHRVIRSWLNKKLGKEDFSVIMNMVNKLLAVFRPTEEVWYAIVNNYGQDGTSLLTYACANPNIPLERIQKLLEIPCFDLGLPDRHSGRNAIQLAHDLERKELLTFFASLVPV